MSSDMDYYQSEMKRIAERIHTYLLEKKKNEMNITQILQKDKCFAITFKCDEIYYYLFTDKIISYPKDTTLNIVIGKNIINEILQYVFLDNPQNKNAGPISIRNYRYIKPNRTNIIDNIYNLFYETYHYYVTNNSNGEGIVMFVPETIIIPIVVNYLESYGKKEFITAMLCINSLGFFVPSYIWEYIYNFTNYNIYNRVYISEKTGKFYVYL